MGLDHCGRHGVVAVLLRVVLLVDLQSVQEGDRKTHGGVEDRGSYRDFHRRGVARMVRRVEAPYPHWMGHPGAGWVR